MSLTYRNIPLCTRIRVTYNRTLTRAGIFVTSLFMLVSWLIAGNADHSFIYFTGDIQTTNGKVLEVIETNFSINESSVWANVFQYSDLSGVVYVRDGFTTGRQLAPQQSIQVEYPINAPQYGRIPGIRSAEFGSWAVALWFLPCIGIIMVFFGIRRGLRDYRLLYTGTLTHAQLTHKESTNTRINDQPVYKLTFDFTDCYSATHHITLRTHLVGNFEDDDLELIVYDPRNPSAARLLDQLPEKIRCDEHGELAFPTSSFPFMTFIYPVILIAPHIWYYTTL